HGDLRADELAELGELGGQRLALRLTLGRGDVIVGPAVQRDRERPRSATLPRRALRARSARPSLPPGTRPLVHPTHRLAGMEERCARGAGCDVRGRTGAVWRARLGATLMSEAGGTLLLVGRGRWGRREGIRNLRPASVSLRIRPLRHALSGARPRGPPTSPDASCSRGTTCRPWTPRPR